MTNESRIIAARPQDDTVPSLVGGLTSIYGDAPQIIDRGGVHSFNAIAERSALIARSLLDSGVAKGARIGVLMPNGADFISAMFGVQRAGGVAVLLSTFMKPPELAFAIRHADLHLLLTAHSYLSNDYVSRLEEALPELRSVDAADDAMRLTEAPYLRGIHMQSDSRPRWAKAGLDGLEAAGRTGQATAELLAAAEKSVSASEPAVMIFTSGSTAAPKAILHSHGAFVRQARHMGDYFNFAPGDRVITSMPLFWVGGLLTSLLAANCAGAALVCPDDTSPTGMVADMRKHNVNSVLLWPAQLATLQNAPGFSEMRDRLKPPNSQHVAFYGVASPDRTPNSLGMTESMGPHALERYGDLLPDGCAGSFGRALPGMEHRIVDPASGEPLAVGERGEIAIRGVNMMLGMHKMERREVFRADGFYLTGDMGWINADGYLFFDGRKDDLVKVSGANVSPREVELALMAEPGVQEAAVLGVPDDKGDEILTAVIVARPGFELSVPALQESLRAKLSSYKAPRDYHFFAVDDLPRTDSEKVKKPVLRQLIVDRKRRQRQGGGS